MGKKILGYNITLKVGEKVFAATTSNSFDITPNVKESQTKDDEGTKNKTVSGYEYSFGIDAVVELTVAFLAHRHVSITSHTDSYDIFEVFIPFHTLTEKVIKPFFVCLIVPRTYFFFSSGVFFMGAHHWFMVGGSHDNSVLIGQNRIHRIIFVKCTCPHGGPEVVSLQT